MTFDESISIRAMPLLRDFKAVVSERLRIVYVLLAYWTLSERNQQILKSRYANFLKVSTLALARFQSGTTPRAALTVGDSASMCS